MSDYEFDSDGKLTLYDREGKEYVEIQYSDGCYQDYIANDLTLNLELGDCIRVKHPILADVMGVEPVERYDDKVIDRTVAQARKNGDIVAYAEYGEHSAVNVRFCSEPPANDWDSACVGVVVFPRAQWEKNFSKPYTEENVFEWFNGLAEQVTANINGWVKEAYSSKEDCDYGPFYSEEEAVNSMLEEFPECQYTAEQLEELNEAQEQELDDVRDPVEEVLDLVTKRCGLQVSADIRRDLEQKHEAAREALQSVEEPSQSHSQSR